jgi:putative membrane-bound dehydrogenase-like protein
LPQLVFIPDADHDGVPDGQAKVVLDGFEVARENYHNFANGLKWGPDGWLYGRCGGSCPAKIGLPDAPPEARAALEGGLWRYHPVTRQFDVLTTGTTNPWGHDWNENYEAFFVNTVNGHLWHAIPGAHFTRPFTLDPNTRTYGLIDQHADHFHFDTGKSWTASRDGAANSLGGGHAHSGTMIYQGNQWPREYHNQLFTLNFHGRRMNVEQLDREGSGYVGRHRPDMFLSPDPWFRGIDLDYGPDGSVYVLDWSDTGECHENTGVHRTSGRIFKVTHNSPNSSRGGPWPQPAIDSRSDAELVAMQGHPNEWYVRQARLELAARAVAGKLNAETIPLLRQQFAAETNNRTRLRLLVTWGAVLGMQSETIDQSTLQQALASDDEALRAWAIRLATDTFPLDDAMSGQRALSEAQRSAVAARATALLPTLQKLAETDPSALVRLTLASTLQRLPIPLRPALATALVMHPEDADDHNLPLMVWYGLIPVADVAPNELVPVCLASQWPLTRQLIVRRLSEEIEARPQAIEALLQQLTKQRDPSLTRDVVLGMSAGLKGWRKAKAPAAWPEFVALAGAMDSPDIDESLKNSLRDLSILFGDGRAMADVRLVALDNAADPASRLAALETLSESQPEDLAEILVPLLKEARFNVAAARGLAQWKSEKADRPLIGKQIAASYRSFRAPVRPQIIALLTIRKEYARALMQAVAEGKIPAADLTAFDIRQMRSLRDKDLDEKLVTLWGGVRETSADKQQTIADLKAKLTTDVFAQASLAEGRRLFTQHCSKCHKLYGEGGAIGPDLTGAQRSNLDYLLENIIDPSAVVSKDYRMSIAELEDGRVISGVIVEQTARTLTLQTQTERVTLERSEIAELSPTEQSPMPEEILKPLSPEQVRDLIAYLKHPQQVPLTNP